MKKAVILLLLVLIPAIVFAEITKKIVDRYPEITTGEVTLPGAPKTVLYLNSAGKEVAKEVCDETGTVVETTGKIPDGIVKEYFGSGKLLAEYNYKSGKLEGVSRGYYESGAFRGEWNYKAGELEGIVKVYYENGNLNYEMHYKNGELHGTGKYYRENGKLHFAWNFKDGKKEGISTTFYEDGKIKGEINYKDDKKDGLSRGYYEDGKIQYEMTYKNGEKINEKKYDRKGILVPEKVSSEEGNKKK